MFGSDGAAQVAEALQTTRLLLQLSAVDTVAAPPIVINHLPKYAMPPPATVSRIWCLLPILVLAIFGIEKVASQVQKAGILTASHVVDLDSLMPKQWPASAWNWRQVVEGFSALSLYFVTGAGIILLNNYIMSDLNFPHPIFVSNLGNLALVLVTRCLVWTGIWPLANPTLPPGSFQKIIFPLSAFSSSSMILGNWAYLYLSVPLIQILKSMTLVLVMCFGFIVGTEKYHSLLVASVIIIVVGLVISVAGNSHNQSRGTYAMFLLGLAMMFGASVCEAARAVYLQVSVDKLSFLDSLYWCSPVMAGILLILSISFEFDAWVGLFYISKSLSFCLLGSAVLGGMVSFATFWTMKFLGSLSMKVMVNTRNLALVLFSVIVLGEPCSFRQYLGYSMALLGIGLYDKSRQILSESISEKKDTSEQEKGRVEIDAERQSLIKYQQQKYQ